jgi:pectate lyase
MYGGIVSIALGGCTDGIVRVFRSAPSGGGAGGSGVALDAATDAGAPDAAVDVAPIICPTKLVGYATMDGGTTGGGSPDAGMMTATTLDQLRTYANQVGPAVVRVSGTITIAAGEMPIEVESDKTLLPAKFGDGLLGNGFMIKDKHNVIVRNLKIAKALSPWDAITIQASTNVWIDHCDLSSDRDLPKTTYDGLVDVVHGSSNVTLSWNYFHDHYNPSLVGHSDTPTTTEDQALAVTFHHNWFRNIQSGAPRARFGHVHLFSNFYDTIDSYSIASVMGATLLIEGNVFDRVATPIVTHLDNAPADGTVADLRNLYDPSDGANLITTTQTTWKPPYLYSDSVDSTDSARVVVSTCAGVGKVP